MTRVIFVLNGPNLNLLGKREPGIYGALTLESIEDACRKEAETLGFRADCRQSNHEGVLVDWLHEANEKACGVAINPGAYGHTSIALHDAIRAISVPVVELHISNIHAREPFRHKTMTSAAAKGVICGFGQDSYLLALRALGTLTE
ncbi:type II 3-dehydroquinate dehydratase [Martelella radicis]|uniref:3-dehydroquinate dehydratase n=1 Tax=Martelella radicis TaxID=1397476 RepID=A0A7W6KJR1_9HYPH|nr:type II 3-dehydroquinate dehydratase [Martelella radicis]MBB4122265.1 3-dehydroquinate dehydratase-2 [Martelella radicis]